MCEMDRDEVLVLGGSGLTGSQLLRRLLTEVTGISCVHALVRRPLNLGYRFRSNDSDSRSTSGTDGARVASALEEHVVRFERLEEDHAGLFANPRLGTIFCCLGFGTSAGQFREVEFDYPLLAARLASRNGVEEIHIVTAMLSNARSRFDLFRIKGELQDAIKALPFKRVHFYQPALIVGERAVRRTDEEAMYSVFKYLSPVLEVFIRKPLYNPADDIAGECSFVQTSQYLFA